MVRTLSIFVHVLGSFKWTQMTSGLHLVTDRTCIVVIVSCGMRGEGHFVYQQGKEQRHAVMDRSRTGPVSGNMPAGTRCYKMAPLSFNTHQFAKLHFGGRSVILQTETGVAKIRPVKMSILGGLIASGTSMKSRPTASCHINLTKLDIMWCLKQDFSVFKCLRFRVSHILTQKLSIHNPTRGDVFSVQFFSPCIMFFSLHSFFPYVSYTKLVDMSPEIAFSPCDERRLLA